VIFVKSKKLINKCCNTRPLSDIVGSRRHPEQPRHNTPSWPMTQLQLHGILRQERVGQASKTQSSNATRDEGFLVRG
jgi:hypothetical protein